MAGEWKRIMATIYRVEYDAYRVGDRLLDGVSFAIVVEIEGQKATIQAIEPWSPEDASFMAKLNFEHFAELARIQFQGDLDYLMERYAEEGGSFEEDMAQFEAETGLPGIQLLMEV